jgi:Polyketide cyclase / dehydrase and lipid transport
MLRKSLIALAVVFALLLVLVATRPSTFSVERSATVAAPAAVVYAQVADFHRWDAWSPWAKLDPSQVTTFSGAGVGATYEWTGNDKVGQGKMTITDARPGELVAIKLEFIKPFASTNRTEFRFAPEGPGTKVVWRMSGENSFLSKAMGLVVSMDEMIGKDFERGLGQLKTQAQDAALKAAQAEVPAPPAAPEGAPVAPQGTGQP